jgi:hypothetical protein
MYKMLPVNVKELSLDEQRIAVDAIERSKWDLNHTSRKTESEFILAAAGAQKRVGDGWTIPTLGAKIADMLHQNAKALSQNDPGRKERLSKAVVSPTYVWNWLKTHERV